MSITLANGSFLPQEGFLRIKDLCDYSGKNGTRKGILSISRSTFLKGIKDGRFPRPVKLGPRTTAWRTQDIREVIAGTWKTPTDKQYDNIRTSLGTS